MATKPALPTIVTTDDSNTPSEPIQPPEPTHARSPSDTALLSPVATGAQAPSSPGAPPTVVPPSPTFSNHSSVHWQDSRALRQNEVDGTANGGMSSLLEPGNAKHGRKASVTSYTSTVPDEKPSTLSPTQTGTTAAATLISDKKKSKKSSDESDESEEAAPHHIDPSQDDTNPAPFAQKPLVLASLVDPKSLQSLLDIGGSDGLLRGLGTHPDKGLRSWQFSESGQRSDPESGNGGGAGAGGDTPESRASAEDRKRVYGINEMPARKSKSLLLLMWLALKDKVLVLLSIAAVVSLALGLYSDFGTPPEQVLCDDGVSKTCTAPRVDWVEGVAIMIAILIVVVVGSLNDWQKERQFRKLNDKKEDRGVKVIRDGNEQVINVKDVLVGDICLLEPGEIIPCDGVFLRGHNVRCDESGATGESDAIKKVTYEECQKEVQNLKSGEKAKLDCFIVSGSKVLEGVGQYVVIAVGPKSFNGRIMAALSGDTESTPLQLKLNALAELIAKLGSAAGLILFTALMIKFFVQLKTNPGRTASVKAMAFVQILIISVTLIVVAVPEGLPLAVTLALAFATKRMTKERLLVRVLGSCETMANASVVCTDKTGTLTQNVMAVVAGSVGIHCKFVQHLSENEGRQNVDHVLEDHEVGSERNKSHKDDFPLEMAELNSVVQEPLRSMFNEAIAVNSTAFEDKNPETGEVEFVGSKTETALLRFAKDLKWAPYQPTRQAADVMQMIPFSSERKAMGVVVRTSNGKFRLYLKGASEILTKMCKRHVIVRHPNTQPQDAKEVETAPITELEEENISRTIIFYANQMLRTIAVAYREFEQWPPAGHTGASDEVPYESIAEDLTLIGIVGIEDPLRPGVKEAVQTCQRAGVTIKMCTGDNVLTARSIASQCGIFTAGGIIMEGPVFRRLSPEEQREIVPRLQVLARSSPEDKRILVDTLKGLGEIVGVTGDGTNDGPALKHANVGFSMGIAGTEIAKEASDIILMDDNFASIVSAIMWGRCVNDSVRKFLQFQVSVNITAVLITFISAVASAEEESVLTAVQLLWINIIMDTFAALALATDPASPALLNRMPDRKTAPLFSVDMGKMILGQSIYQTFIILLFHFGGGKFWGYTTEKEHSELSTMVFNTFVFCQIFNSINCRSLSNDKNIFRGLTKNWYFMVITVIEVAIQVLIVFFGGAAFQVTSMNGRDWGLSIALGFVSIPLGYLIRLIPTAPVERLFIATHVMRDPNAPPKLTKAEKKEEAERKREEDKERWNPAITQVRDRLETFSNIRGARMRSSSFVRKSRSQRQSEQEDGDVGVFPSLMAMVPTLVVSSVGAGWAPKPGKLEDPAGTDPSKSSSALWRGQIQIHPDTKSDDFVHKWGKESA